MSEAMTTGDRLLGPGRAAALTLVAVLVIGLGYLRFAPEESLEVPSGAHAGDLILEPCEYETEAGALIADCGTLVVPENGTDPDTRLIALRIVRIRARSDRPAEPVFHLAGGPGLSNMRFATASRFVENHDVVLVGYRGIDGSVRLDCPEVEAALTQSADLLAEESFRAQANGFRTCAQRLTDEGVDLTSYGLVQQVDDLELARVALGYDRINLLSESAGTRTAMIYAWRHPQSIHRSVMVGVGPPGSLVYDPQVTDEQFGRYAELCAEDTVCRTRTENLDALVRRTAADMPTRWLFLPIKGGNVRLLSFLGLMEPMSASFPPGPVATFDAWLSAASGDASGFWLASVVGDLLFPRVFIWGQSAAAGSIDAQAARDYFSSVGQEDSSSLVHAANAFFWSGGRLVDVWPAALDEDTYDDVRLSKVETLLIGGELDVSTPPQLASHALLPNLPNSRAVVLPGFGHTASFWGEQPEAGTLLINTFFDSGQTDDSLYEPQEIDFTPSSTLTGIAKLAAGAMIGLGLLALFSLWWVVRRVNTRGGFSPGASAALRVVHPIILGLGGWALGALIVLVTMPSVALDNQLLAVLSVGTPIGFGVYWAWVHRDWPQRTKIRGLLATIGGALIGAWLGSNTIEGLPSIITTIVGAAVGANLPLILGDIYEDRRGARSQAQRHPPRQAQNPSYEARTVQLND